MLEILIGFVAGWIVGIIIFCWVTNQQSDEELKEFKRNQEEKR